MRVSLRWLRDYVEVTVPPEELARRLTAAGLEVSGVEEIGAEWDSLYVGHLTTLEPHPRADRLQVGQVTLGDRSFAIVSGAPNLRVGVKVPVALEGAQVRDAETGEPVPVQRRLLRGVLSEAVLCSERELGLSEEHMGIMLLPEDAPVGALLREYLGDTVLEVEATANRPDWLSMLGIAWEVAALTGQLAHLPSTAYPSSGRPVEERTSVEIQAPDLCPRYTCTVVSEVRVGPSPPWMQRRLLAAGMRPINNIVDITNYVMLEYGQPLHAFDLETLRGQRIVVRRAQEGESIVSIDGEERALRPEMLVIADAERPVAVAGVMGGAETEVTQATRAILLESALFQPASIRRAARGLALRTEASLRFEKGLSAELPLAALERATQLLGELAGGSPAPGVIDAYPQPRPPTLHRLEPERVNGLLGSELSVEQMRRVLASLGFVVEAQERALLVNAPFWRADVEGEADLTEEVARIVGYMELPEALAAGELPAQADPGLWAFKERLRDLLVACGLQEVITYSLVSRRDLELLGPKEMEPEPLRTINPLSPEQEYLRPTLRPGILKALEANQRREPEADLRLFELGRVYLPRAEGLPEEREMAVGVLSGPREGRTWHSPGQTLDLYDAKGAVETILSALGLSTTFVAAQDPALSPGQMAQIWVQGLAVGWIGVIHPLLASALHLTTYPVALLELDVSALASLAVERHYRTLPRYPSVVQDLALVVEESTPATWVEALLRRHPLVTEVTLFDVYRGEPVPQGSKSLAYALVFRSPERTLTDEEVREARDTLVQSLLQELGAVLR